MSGEPRVVVSRAALRWKVLAVLAAVVTLLAVPLAWPRQEGRVAVQAGGRADEDKLPEGFDDPASTTSTAASTPSSVTTAASQPTEAPAAPTSTTTGRPPTPTPTPTTIITGGPGVPVHIPATTPTAPPTTTTRAVSPLAPRARSMTLSPKEIDTSAGPATVTVRLRVIDDQGDTQMSSMTVRFAAAFSDAQVGDVPYEAWRLAAGDAYDGIYEGSLTLRQHSATGLWRFDHVMLRDSAGNYQYQFPHELADSDFDDGFTQTGPGDSDAPDLASFSLTPTIVESSQGQAKVTFTARITDPVAGVTTNSDQYYFTSSVVVASPSGQTYFAHMSWMELIAGDTHDATYRSVLSLPTGPEPGLWVIRQVHLGDLIGNQTNVWTDDLAAAGFPNSFTVTG